MEGVGLDALLMKGPPEAQPPKPEEAEGTGDVDMAAQQLLDAVSANDVAGVAAAMRAGVMACQAEYDKEP